MTIENLNLKGIDQIVSSINCVDESDLEKYEVDGLRPRVIAVPKDEEEITSVLSIANSEKLKVIVMGSGTEMALGNIPNGLDIVILTKRCEKIVSYSPDDMTISLQSGVEIERVQKEIEKKDQFIPIDPSHPNATIGGILSANTTGVLRTRFGTIRDILLGVKVVSPMGKITKAGGNVVKNVAGYDLTKLYVGALGTLGLVLEANLKLHPLPEQEGTLIIFLNDIRDVGDISREIIRKSIPYSLELLDITLLNTLAKFIHNNTKDFLYFILVRYNGTDVSVSNQISETDMSIKGRIGVRTEMLFGDESKRLWNTFRSISAEQRSIACKVSVPRSMSVSVFKRIKDEMSIFDPVIFSEPSVGIIHLLIKETNDQKYLVDRVSGIRTFAEENSGSLVIETAPTSVKKQIDVWGTPPSGIEIMRSIKKRFDPNNIMSPGRYIGGM